MITANEIKEMVKSNSKAKSFFKRTDVKAALKEMGLTKKAIVENVDLAFDEQWRNQMADILNGNGGLKETAKSDRAKAVEWAAKKFNQDAQRIEDAMFELKNEATYKGLTDFQAAAAAAKLVEKSNNL